VQDRNIAKGFECQQILVERHNHIRLAIHGAFDNWIVIRIADDLERSCRLNDFGKVGDFLEPLGDGLLILLLQPAQHSAGFIDDEGGSDELKTAFARVSPHSP